MFGNSPKEFWKECRLQRAAEELKTPLKPVKQIAKELGYKQGTFIDAFKKKFGVTPMEWRGRFK
jgi:AraC-like DNA-binding protein